MVLAQKIFFFLFLIFTIVYNYTFASDLFFFTGIQNYDKQLDHLMTLGIIQ